MHDIRAIRDDPDTFDAALARRGLEGASGSVLALDTARRAKINAAETAQAEQNRASKEVGAAKARGDEGEFARLRVLVGEKKAEGRHDAGRGQGSRCATDANADGGAQPALRGRARWRGRGRQRGIAPLGHARGVRL